MLPVCGESNQTTNCITPRVEAWLPIRPSARYFCAAERCLLTELHTYYYVYVCIYRVILLFLYISSPPLKRNARVLYNCDSDIFVLSPHDGVVCQ
jgi:hypothetical protein